MSHLIVRTLGLLAAVAVLTASTPTFAAAPADDPSLYLTKKKATSLVGLSPELQKRAIQAARSRSNGTQLTTPGRTPQPWVSDMEMDLLCGDDWLVTWEEDADGDPILGTFTVDCAGAVIPLP
jgi:hypothetical protein